MWYNDQPEAAIAAAEERGKTVECPKCGGDGKLKNPTDLDHVLGICYRCDGTGRIPRELKGWLEVADWLDEQRDFAQADLIREEASSRYGGKEEA